MSTASRDYTEEEYSAFHAGFSQALEMVQEEAPDADLPRTFDHHIRDMFLRWVRGGKR